MIRTKASVFGFVVAIVLVATTCLLPRVARATPSRDGCTGILRPDLAPYPGTVAVSTPGVWCLDRDQVSTVQGSAITMIEIHADDVTIDCRGYRLEYAGDEYFSAGVISFSGDRPTVRNCRMRGFQNGIELGGQGLLIEDNVVEQGRVGSESIFAAGSGTIRRNRVHAAIDVGLQAQGSFVLEDNLIDGVTASQQDGYARGIVVTDEGPMDIRGNTIRGLANAPGSTGPAVVGIEVYPNVGPSGPVRIIDNVLAHDGITAAVALDCQGSAQPRYADNVIVGFPTAALSCSDAGDNDVSP